MRIAWLLRADLRQGAPAGGPLSDWFKMWWLINGQREYPHWAGHDILRESNLFRPMPEWPMYGGFGMTPALHFLLETRSDLASEFDVSTNEGLWDAIAWLFVHGVQEHQLATAIDEKTRAALDAVPPFFATKDLASSAQPQITWLMFFAWKSDVEIQKHFDLQNSKERYQYVIWFLLKGVQQLKVAPLIAERWKQWLREPALGMYETSPIPRASYLLWQQHDQLQQAFDLTTERGRKGFTLWVAEVRHTKSELSWIEEDIKPEPSRDHAAKKRPFGLNLIGFAFGELGIGEDVRMAVAACEAARIPFSVINIHAGDSLRQADHALAGHVAHTEAQIDSAPYAFNLFCLTAFDTARVYLERGSELFECRFNIGWWPWELPVWPTDWRFVFDLVDEVWAATTFTEKMYKKSVEGNSTVIKLMPMPASVDRVTAIERQDLGLPEEKFLYLYVFDFNSYIARKNPFAAIEAFLQAFPYDNTVGLVFKTMNTNLSDPIWKKFVLECSKDQRIIVIDKTMTRSEVLGLIQSCDAYVSLHRAEGLGRTLAEAMLFGKPVIGTDFSGNIDFLTSSTGYPVKWKPVPVQQGQYAFVSSYDEPWWADPIISDAADALRQSRTKIGKASPHFFAKHFFSPARIGSLIYSHLQNKIDDSLNRF